MWAPWGQYDPSKLVNLGTNRWGPQGGARRFEGARPLDVELVPGATFFTDNTNFLGGHTRSQDPLYSVQAHVIYSFESGIWAALDGTYFTGGKHRASTGWRMPTMNPDSRVGLTVALPIDRSNSIKFYANNGLATRSGTNFKALGVAWQYRWGGL